MSDEKRYCCGNCIHMQERTDVFDETHHYCDCQGEVYADDPACEYYVGDDE